MAVKCYQRMCLGGRVGLQFLIYFGGDPGNLETPLATPLGFFALGLGLGLAIDTNEIIK